MTNKFLHSTFYILHSILAAVCSLVVLDIFTKWLAKNYLSQPIEIIPQFFQLVLSFNKGIAFSIPIPNAAMIFLTPLLAAALIWLIIKNCSPEKRATKFCMIFIAAGAIGNFINRLWTGAVIDFLDFSFWPSFNLADAYLTIGALLLIIFYGKIKKT
ncbi:signal peptidase II [Candidatus Peregrinibacteria bacterium]|nr:signal peptidase II [Candidatus Peregrinibacteria bacterium]